jgi:hypothetical protein
VQLSQPAFSSVDEEEKEEFGRSLGPLPFLPPSVTYSAINMKVKQ